MLRRAVVEPMVEQLVLIREMLVQQLTGFRLYKAGDVALKSRWVAAVQG